MSSLTSNIKKYFIVDFAPIYIRNVLPNWYHNSEVMRAITHSGVFREVQQTMYKSSTIEKNLKTTGFKAFMYSVEHHVKSTSRSNDCSGANNWSGAKDWTGAKNWSDANDWTGATEWCH